MTDDFTSDEFEARTAMNKQLPDETPADPVAVVLMLQQEAGNTQHEHPRISMPLKHAEIKERVLRRMLENSLECPIPAKRPRLKIVK
jgi:hypothetical protein